MCPGIFEPARAAFSAEPECEPSNESVETRSFGEAVAIPLSQKSDFDPTLALRPRATKRCDKAKKANHYQLSPELAVQESVAGGKSGKPVALMPGRFRQPRVALLIETSRSYGRDLLVGIARYVRAHPHWDIEFGESNPYDKLPRWFQLWEGDEGPGARDNPANRESPHEAQYSGGGSLLWAAKRRVPQRALR